jgi:AcrR family transcriptional regulator
MNTFMPTSLPRKRNARRDALLNVASDLFSARGFDAVTVSEIALAADLATGTFYNYFPTKTALLLKILNTDLDAMLEEIGRGEASKGEPIDALRGLGLSIFRVVDRRSRALWRQVIGQAMLDPAGFGRAYAEVDARLRAEVEAALAQYETRLPPAHERQTLTDLVFNLGNALFYEYISDETLTLDTVRRRFEAQLRLVFTGIGDRRS